MVALKSRNMNQDLDEIINVDLYQVLHISLYCHLHRLDGISF